MRNQPKASSTPKIFNLRGRRGIGEQDDTVQSPIVKCNNSDSEYETDEHPSNQNEKINYQHKDGSLFENTQRRSLSPSKNRLLRNRSPCKGNSKVGGNSYKTNDSLSRNNFTEDESLSKNNRQGGTVDFKCISALVLIVSVIILSKLFSIIGSEETQISNISMEELKHQFPSQKEDFWLNIDVAVKETNSLRGPISVILYYQDDGYKSIDSILKKISEYALCQLTTCSSKPVIINGKSLQKKDVVDDYGRVIVQHKEQLEESGVMIVKNLEQVPGISAQAFHSLCDEINPVIKKALYLFTVKLESVEGVNMKFLENHFRHLWSDLDEDRFSPLFTRISSILLPVMSEE